MEIEQILKQNIVKKRGGKGCYGFRPTIELPDVGYTSGGYVTRPSNWYVNRRDNRSRRIAGTGRDRRADGGGRGMVQISTKRKSTTTGRFGIHLLCV